MKQKLKARLRKIFGYPALFVAAFAFFLYVTFPYSALEKNLVDLAKANGLGVTFGSLGPGLFGATAQRIAISIPASGTETAPALTVEKVTVRPALFPPGVAISARTFGGKASGSMALLRKRPSFKLGVSGMDLGKAGLKEAVGLDVVGEVGGRVAVDIDPKDVI